MRWLFRRGRARVTADTARLKRALDVVRARTGKPVSFAGTVDLALDVLVLSIESGAVDISGQPRVLGREIHEA